MDDAEGKRSAFVALLGAPNAGKSTLVNALVGAKIAIVTHKAQTTRAPLRGIFVEGDAQIVLIDAPGVFAPKRKLDRAMVRAAWDGAAEADIALVVIDAARGIGEEVDAMLARVPEIDHPVMLVLNKIDRVRKPDLLQLAQALNARAAFAETFMVSALTGDGVVALKQGLAAAAPPGPWHYPEDQLTDAPLRMAAAEITREKLMTRLHDELPYALTVETSDWKQLNDGSVRIEQTIYVERDSQRAIVLGAKGRTIKEISMASRKDIAEIAERKVHLFLFVKVRERWGEDPERFREMGLDPSER
jgi:GTP-binding protein Era